MAPRLRVRRVECDGGLGDSREVTSSSFQRAPTGPLSSFIRGIRAMARGPRSDGSYVRLPDGEAELIFRFTPTRGDAYVVGTRQSVFHKQGDDVPPEAIAVRFKAGGAYPFFGVPMSTLNNRVVSLDTLWGREGALLREALCETSDMTERVRQVESTLAARLRSGEVFEPASAHVVRRAVRTLTQATELPRVDALARELGVSERQLRRAFDDVVGMGPKAFARIVRFQRAVRASRRTSSPDWGAIAAATGYYDQAHLITEFRDLTGVTPRALLRAEASTASLTG
ncbi:AraC family transcriptional regulator [Myxococcus sp. K15C18031901]|uniref:helix-turn-helix domain-containing protein n=1 Tax=Myxococcus dinghuensis TaxID=2906761 RepID=UPI0020A7D742|nr:AraC family transcriptional regulator [Myxococcus dinghuensis]MCP3098907.1 AraC family transcriptional regulator [Myxococcus dinghuensis]